MSSFSRLKNHVIIFLSAPLALPRFKAYYVAAPSTSCDLVTKCGADIEIEERPEQELRCTAGVQVKSGYKDQELIRR